MSSTIVSRLALFSVALATALSILAVAILPFLTPAWLAVAQERADVTAWTGYTPAQVRTVTDALVRDLILGSQDFAVELDGQRVLGERERSHLRDVRGVLAGLGVLALVSLALLLVAWRTMDRIQVARWIRTGALALAGGTVIVGLLALVAFDAAFEVFHQLLFAGGTWTFDPQTDRLVQLFPWQLWFETSLAAGVVIVSASLVVAWGAGRKRRTSVAGGDGLAPTSTGSRAASGAPR